MKIDYKQFGIILILSLVAITIISVLISNLIEISTIHTGPAFVILCAGLFLVYIFIAGSGGFDKKEIWTLIFLAASLFAVIYVLKHFAPSIFAIFPSETKSLFSALI